MSADFSHDYDVFHWMSSLGTKTVFTKEAQEYFSSDVITLVDDKEQLLNLTVLSRELGEDELGQEMRLQFRVEAKSLAERGLPAPMLWYTFDSRLSLEENKRNLRNFVISHYRTAATPPTILPKHPSYL